MSDLKTTKTLRQITECIRHANDWMQTPANQQTELGQCLAKLQPKFFELLKPTRDLDDKLKSDKQKCRVDHADTVKVTDWPNKPDMLALEYMYNKVDGKENPYHASEAAIVKLTEKHKEDMAKLLDSEVVFEPMYAKILPPTTILPANYITHFRGIVISPDAKAPAGKGNVRHMDGK